MSAPIRTLLTDSDPKKLNRYGRMSLWGEMGYKVTAAACDTLEALNKLDSGEVEFAVLVSRPPETDAETILCRCKELGIPTLVILPRKTSEEYRLAGEKAFALLEGKNINSEFMGKLRSFIASCEGETATTCSAAEYFSFNKDYFGKLFKQETGMTFNSFYNSFRIEYAKQLLSSGSYRINEISELLGFSSVDYFTGVFKRLTGCTPSGYRQTIE